MASTSELLAQALAHHQAGQLQEAEQLYRQVLTLEPNNVDTLHYLGILAHEQGRDDVAREYILRALALKPDSAEANYNLGIVLSALGDRLGAISALGRAAEIKPDFAEAQFKLGNALKEIGRLNESEQCLHAAVALDPNFSDAYNNLGNVLLARGKLDEAFAAYQRAHKLRPDDAELLYNLGFAAQERGELDSAIEFYRRAIERAPQLVAAHINLGSALREKGEAAEAIRCFGRALELKPDSAEALNGLGSVYHEECRTELAIDYYRRAIELRPSFPKALNNMALALMTQGQLDEALDCADRALRLEPDFADAHVTKSFILLLCGEFAHGWQEYEWRWKTKHVPSPDRYGPVWRGEPLEGKTILLHAEQGFGDTIQFIRYAANVKDRGGATLVRCPRTLLPLLRRCPGIDRIRADDERPEGFDTHAPLLSLPRIFGTRIDSIPSRVPYLFADPALVESWRTRLSSLKGFRIGINWRGRGGLGTFRRRDIPAREFAALAQVPGVQLVSLRKDVDAGELSGDMPMLDLGGELDAAHGAFMDTAAVMMNLDLVITSDTAIPHLAGALGIPVWLALPFVPEWRWLLDRSDSPWYPTMRLFRQKRTGDWAGVFREIEDALIDLVRSSGR
jgi:tetratricopeptide (TPR) repeat protein